MLLLLIQSVFLLGLAFALGAGMSALVPFGKKSDASLQHSLARSHVVDIEAGLDVVSAAKPNLLEMPQMATDQRLQMVAANPVLTNPVLPNPVLHSAQVLNSAHALATASFLNDVEANPIAPPIAPIAPNDTLKTAEIISLSDPQDSFGYKEALLSSEDVTPILNDEAALPLSQVIDLQVKNDTNATQASKSQDFAAQDLPASELAAAAFSLPEPEPVPEPISQASEFKMPKVSSLAAMTPDTVATFVAAAQETAEPLYLDKPMGEKDNLQLISGIGTDQERELNVLGIYHYWQIASWEAENIAWLAQRLRAPDRIGRENWMSQALRLKNLPKRVS